MTTEKAEETSAVEGMTKQEMAKIIKTAKSESESSEKERTVSVCDSMKANTSKIIQKIESNLPIRVHLYTDLYTKYLHTMDDLYSTCYMSQKGFFDKLGMNEAYAQASNAYLKSLTNMALSQIDMNTNFAKIYVQFRLAAIDSYDKTVHFMMDIYARVWNQFNLYNKKQL
ncbi:MAG: hypothetical protein KGI27_01015 [Thaumarchaeota archaeon]|nr:hypothetical protein [Nitrososphaerota archaeon]